MKDKFYCNNCEKNVSLVNGICPSCGTNWDYVKEDLQLEENNCNNNNNFNKKNYDIWKKMFFVVFGIVILMIGRIIYKDIKNNKRVNESTQKKYYVYCNTGYHEDKWDTDGNGYYIQYKNIFLKECSKSGTGYGNIHVKNGYQANLGSEWITPYTQVYYVVSVSYLDKRYQNPSSA